MYALNLILLSFIVVFCIDYSGFIEEADKMLTKLFKSKVPLHIPKPWNCGTCLCWWGGLIYLLANGIFTVPYICLVALLSALTPEILSIIYFIKDLINKIFTTLEEFLKIK